MTPNTTNALDRYRVIAQLGRGGMADVYLAAARGPGGFSKLLVMKVLSAALARDDDFLTMFRDEARLAARLNHPNIVQTYEVGESDGRHFIAMEYLEGQPLNRVAETFRKSENLTIAMALRIIMDALSGLHYAHELPEFDGRPLGVVHRDITPQNIFVTYEGQVKVVDFGIAKALDSSTHTKVGTVKGKVSYMAPEQARGEVVERTADIFSMGVILWELLAGRRLWEGLADIAVIGRLVQGDIPNIAKIQPNLPPHLAELTMRSLDPDPAERPPTALAFQRELEVVFDSLKYRYPSRKLGESLREEFQEERAQSKMVVSKQLERLVRDSSTGLTPPGGWKLGEPGAGDMPILGEGSSVHEAVTTLHTGFTSQPMLPGSAQSAAHQMTGMTDTSLHAHDRTVMWVALAAVGAAGLAIGVAEPWKSLGDANQPPVSQAAAAETAPLPVLPAAAQAHARPTHAGCDSTRKPLVELTGEIGQDAELTCDKDYLLRFTAYVAPGATLSIEPGTTIRGDLETKGTLVVQPGARIRAIGTPERPIVFTSASEEGRQKPGDWGGLILLGEAPTNLKDASGKSMMGRIEGITSGGEYGGSNPEDSSGVLSFIRIEYSGTEIAPNNEINGLTLGGVGRGTVIDHVQVRHTGDDCFEFFGGTVDAKYLVCQAPGDDSFDWDYGYTGRLQFLLGQADSSVSDGSNGFEGDNDPNSTKNTPVSHPLIYNATLCGKNRRMETQEHYGVLLRRGSEMRLRNAMFIGFGAGLDVRDPGTKPNIAASIFYQNLAHNLAYPENSQASRSDRLLSDDDAAFDEKLYLENEGLRVSSFDPKIGNCFDERAPGFKPQHALYENAALPPRDGFFDVDAQYVGAFRDAQDSWDAGTWIKWGR